MMVEYRDATPADADALALLARRSFTDTFGHLYAPEDLAAFLTGHNPLGWAAELGNVAYAVRLAVAAGEPIAYAKLGPPDTLPFIPQGPSIELRQFYVLQPWHGSGLANELMTWVLATARARGARAIYLSVFVDNARARRFYERFGFERVGTYAFKVGNHADEDDVMRLIL